MEQNNLLNEFSGTQELATTGQRLANYLIDVILFYIVIFVVSFVMGIMFASSVTADNAEGAFGMMGLVYLVFFAVFFAYYILLEGGKGKTLGKMITKTKVVSEDGSSMTYSKAFIRTLCRLVPFEFISVFIGPKMWHDQWSKTMVVKDK
jgi:uncharacterized RDD family membrane protein YckC